MMLVEKGVPQGHFGVRDSPDVLSSRPEVLRIPAKDRGRDTDVIVMQYGDVIASS